NLETTRQKLLQIILIGQPELRALLSRTDMRQLAQRITGRYHLEPLSREESDAYIDHRLQIAGAVGEIFTKAAKRELFRLSGGVPRVINVIADRALLGAFTKECHKVGPELIRHAAREIYGPRRLTMRPWIRWTAIAAAFGAAAVVLLWVQQRPQGPAPAASVAADETPDTGPDLEPSDSKTASPADDNAPTDLKLEALGPLLADQAEQTGTDDAFATLFGLWGADYNRGAMRACKQAEAHQLFCLFQRGSLSQLRSLDRPVILTLRDESSIQHQVVLSGLGKHYAVLNIGGNEHRVSLSQLGDYWFGEYLLLWRPESGEVKAFFPGMRDPAVRWIRASLAAIQGKPASPMESDLYDEALEQRVREYQRERRLTVDGLVGQQTQIAMNTDLGAQNRPRLVRLN
ncbi:MAG TPA: hypothetical protein ENK16_01975, partial [Chromatiales bacterium]|nr:hypothetical protein [Chromatiales bacterium]